MGVVPEPRAPLYGGTGVSRVRSPHEECVWVYEAHELLQNKFAALLAELETVTVGNPSPSTVAARVLSIVEAYR